MSNTIYCKDCLEYKEGDMRIKIGSTIFRPKGCSSPHKCLYDPPIDENDPDKWIREESRWAMRFGIGTNREFGYLGISSEEDNEYIKHVNKIMKEEQDYFNSIKYRE